MERELTSRERAVLDALLSVEFDGVDDLRAQAMSVTVVGGCGCGCPSVDFTKQPGVGMAIKVNAAVVGSHDGLFLFTLGGRLGGIEYVGVSDGGDPAELPNPSLLVIEAVWGPARLSANLRREASVSAVQDRSRDLGETRPPGRSRV